MNTLAERLRHPGNQHLPVIQQSELAECGLACLAMALCVNIPPNST